MGKNSTDTTAAIMAADQVIFRLDQVVCDQCQDQCWSLEGIASGALGNDAWRTPVAFREHMTPTQALLHLMRTVGRQADKVRAREISVLLRETQPSLW